MDDRYSEDDIRAVLFHYGWDGHTLGGSKWLKIRCPFHQDNQSSAAFSSSGGFKCHGCHIKGDPVGVIMKQESVDFARAAAIFEKVVGRKYLGLRSSVTGVGRGRVSGRSTRLVDRNSPLFPDWFRP